MRPRYTWMASSSPATCPGRRSSRSASGMRASAANSAGSGLGGGTGRSSSHPSGTREVGSWARSACRIVVPVRGAPVTNHGSRISSSTTPGSSRTYAASWRRTSRKRSRNRRVMNRPITVSSASSSSAGSSTASGSRKSSLPKSSTPPSASPNVARASASRPSRVNGSSATSAMGRIRPSLIARTHSGRGGGSQVTTPRRGRPSPPAGRGT